MAHEIEVAVQGPWSLSTSKTFWEGFAPAGLATQPDAEVLQTSFVSEHDWSPTQARVTQHEDHARIVVSGAGDLEAATPQVCRFLALDIDARAWPEVGEADPVMAEAQQQLPGLRPCGFHSAYEAAAWSVLSQRIRIVQAAGLRRNLIDQHGQSGAFPSPEVLRSAAELVVIRGANAPDAVPTQEKRLNAEISERYGPQASLLEVSEQWRPFRSWACVYLRVLRERRTHEVKTAS